MSDKKERKLTKREQRRKEKFIEKCQLMEEDGYKTENLTECGLVAFVKNNDKIE